ncbi:hypothetical protein Tco_0342594, partial [Tanacetum coccineum]
GTSVVTDVAELSQRMTEFARLSDRAHMRYMEDWMMHRMTGESTEDYCIGTADGDCSLVRCRSRSTGIACGDTKTDEYTADTGDSTPESVGTAGTAGGPTQPEIPKEAGSSS